MVLKHMVQDHMGLYHKSRPKTLKKHAAIIMMHIVKCWLQVYTLVADCIILKLKLPSHFFFTLTFSLMVSPMPIPYNKYLNMSVNTSEATIAIINFQNMVYQRLASCYSGLYKQLQLFSYPPCCCRAVAV